MNVTDEMIDAALLEAGSQWGAENTKENKRKLMGEALTAALSHADHGGVKAKADECQYSKDNNIPEHRCAVRCIYANEANMDGLKFPLASWKEQAAFEEWAKESRYEMHQHPLHYLFMDKQTNAARHGWKAALAFVRQLQAALTQAPVPTLTGEVETPAPVTHVALPQDVIDLVIAARKALEYLYGLDGCELRSLDEAVEAFAERVPYENEPTTEEPRT